MKLLRNPTVLTVRDVRNLSCSFDVEGSAKDDLTPELIDAAVTFVEVAARSEKNMNKRVYYNERGTSVTVESIRPGLKHTWLADDVRSITMSCYLSA